MGPLRSLARDAGLGLQIAGVVDQTVRVAGGRAEGHVADDLVVVEEPVPIFIPQAQQCRHLSRTEIVTEVLRFVRRKAEIGDRPPVRGGVRARGVIRQDVAQPDRAVGSPGVEGDEGGRRVASGPKVLQQGGALVDDAELEGVIAPTGVEEILERSAYRIGGAVAERVLPASTQCLLR